MTRYQVVLFVVIFTAVVEPPSFGEGEQEGGLEKTEY
jgi:hypothetical protein